MFIFTSLIGTNQRHMNQDYLLITAIQYQKKCLNTKNQEIDDYCFQILYFYILTIHFIAKNNKITLQYNYLLQNFNCLDGRH